MKVRSILLIFIIGFVFSSFNEEDQIEWSEEKRLSWADFRGTPPKEDTDAVATTASGIAYNFSATYNKKNELLIDARVSSYFYPNDSWYKPDQVNDITLLHEQLHFDITELHARKFRKLLKERTFNKKVKQEIRKLYAQTIKELQAMQKKYDRASDYSRNREEQIAWEQIVKAELRKYNAYQ